MADNVAITAGAGTTVATDDIGGGVQVQRVKAVWGPDGTGNDTDVASGKPLPVQLRGSDGTDRSNAVLLDALPAGTATIGAAFGFATTLSTGITRPADTTAYAANDCFSDSTSAPTSGGYTFTGAGRISGGSGIITDLYVISSADPATLLQGELWIADAAMTNVNDNAAFAMSDANTLLNVAVIPFTMLSTVAGSGTTSYAHVQNLSIGYTCVGTANLRFMVKVKNAYTPISGEVLTFRLKVIQTN